MKQNLKLSNENQVLYLGTKLKVVENYYHQKNLFSLDKQGILFQLLDSDLAQIFCSHL
ncbi:hypothetical protein X975_02495, partial [Stegodyphus mimosarum]